MMKATPPPPGIGPDGGRGSRRITGITSAANNSSPPAFRRAEAVDPDRLHLVPERGVIVPILSITCRGLPTSAEPPAIFSSRV
jgi:hypothetical protein